MLARAQVMILYGFHHMHMVANSIANLSPTTTQGGTAGKRFVTAGCDNLVIVWRLSDMNDWGRQHVLEGHRYGACCSFTFMLCLISLFCNNSDWVRDVAWAPSVGGIPHTIASAGQDRMVIIWREENTTWRKTLIQVPLHCVDLVSSFGARVNFDVLQLEAVPWRVSWSLTGNILAVSCDDNSVTLFKEAISGEWTKIEQDAAQHQPH
jgi:protein transport protein SEC13